MPPTTVTRSGRALKMLGQAAPGAATDVTLYAPSSRFAGIITLIVVCNTGAATTFRIHHDNTGATRAVGNALYYDENINASGAMAAGATETEYARSGTRRLFFTNGFEGGLNVRNPGAVSVRSASGACTFTAYGFEEQIL